MRPLIIVLFVLGGCASSDDTSGSAESITPAIIEQPAADPGSIEITVRDFQFFHPFSRSRPLMNATGAAKPDTVRSRDTFGIGLVIDAMNASPHLLQKPDLIGHFLMIGEHGSVSCEITPKRYGRGRGPNHISLDPSSKGQWLDESKQHYEKAWRPGESVRFWARNDCGSFYLLDTTLQEIRLEYQVTAEAMFHPRRAEATFPLPDPDAPIVRSDKQIVILPADAAILQRGEVNGTMAHVAGDVVISWNGEKIERIDLGSLGIRADALTRTSVPDQLTPIEQQEGEITLSISSAQHTHWSDMPAIGKGRRQLMVRGKLSLDTPGLKARLGEVGQEPAAQTALSKAVAVERNRLAQLVPCQRIILITTARSVAPRNGGAAGTKCAALATVDEADFVLRYNLNRYEVPVGLQVRVGKEQRFLPIDHKPLLRFDPR